MAIPTLIDCDPGTDDALALLLAFAAPELDIRAVTVVGGNLGLDRTLPNACAVAGLIADPPPVYPGAARPLLGAFTQEPRVHGADGLGGVALPPGPAPQSECAADAIRRLLRASAAPMRVIGLGPATNLALALATEPALATRIEQLILMTGAWGEGNATPAAEFNAFNDPEALAILLASGAPIVLVGLELTAQALATPARLAALRARGSGRALAAACAIQAGVPASPRLGGLGAPLHDPCAVAWAIRPGLFRTRPAQVTVDLGPGPSRGRTVIDRWGRSGRPANVTLAETLDADGFFALLGERLARLP
ncbi:MAG: nucleoside hydrolase [Acetobacteraceae bacterium]